MNQSNKFFGGTQTVLSLKQPITLLRLLSINRKIPKLCQVLFNCNNKDCIVCTLYIKPWVSFKISDDIIWYIRSHITCQSKNVIYFLKWTYIGKTVDLLSRMNNRITSRRLRSFTDKFDTMFFVVCRTRNRNGFCKA